MAVDIVFLAGAIVFAILGYFSGALRQLARLACLVLGYAAARVAGIFLADPLAASTGWAPATAKVVITFGGWLAAFLILSAIARMIIKSMVEDDEDAHTIDSLLGAVLGTIKYGVIAFLVVCLASSVAGRQPDHVFNETFGLDESIAGQLAQQHNLLSMVSPEQVGSAMETVRGLDELLVSAAGDLASESEDDSSKQQDGGQATLESYLSKGGENGPNGAAVTPKPVVTDEIPEDLIKNPKYRRLLSRRLRAGARVKTVANELKGGDSEDGGSGTCPRVRERQKKLEKLLENEKVRNVVENSELVRKVRSGQFFDVVGDPDFQRLMTDPDAVSGLLEFSSDRMLGSSATVGRQIGQIP